MHSHTDISIERRVMRALACRARSELGRSLRSDPFSALEREFTHGIYSDAKSHARDWLLYNFLRKWKGWGTTKLARDKAIDTWIGAEAKCFATNCNLRTLSPSLMGRRLDFIIEVRRKIELVITKDIPWSWLEAHCRWSGGATYAHKRGTLAADKQRKTFDVTEACVNLARVWLWCPYTEAAHLAPELRFNVVRGNRAVTVPKTAKTDRMIACEPSANAFCQQAIGQWFRKRLKSVGVDLNDQTINQEAAFRARVDDLSTLDLSSASDTLSIALVDLLLPYEWVKLLCMVRSPFTLLDGKWYFLEKFSSMGNAFTFELESLIFWAISSCVASYVVVYGDDIIVDQKSYDNVVSALSLFGFIPNQEKSFKAGPFYESCGKHFFDLEDVTPAYQKEHIPEKGYARLAGMIRLHNKLYRWASRTNDFPFVRDALHLIRKVVDEEGCRVPVVPEGFDDSGFWVPLGSKELRVDQNGDFYCLRLFKVPVVQTYVPETERMACALKLRCPSLSNVGPDGSAMEEIGFRWVLTKRRIWRSSLSDPKR